MQAQVMLNEEALK